jgi:hypothetical protein
MTDFEKLLWALGYIRHLKHRIKSLEFEAGVLKSELSEAKYQNGMEEIERLKALNKYQKEQLDNQKRKIDDRKKVYKKVLCRDAMKIRQLQTEIIELKRQTK